MNRCAVFAVVVAVTAATVSAQGVSLIDDVSGASWSQNADGVLLPGVTTRPASAKRTSKLRVYSAVSRAPLPAAVAWWVEPEAGTPLFHRSNLMADEKGDLHIPHVSGLRLRVWAEGHEVVEIDSSSVARLTELALWPGASATLHVEGATSPVAVRYFIGQRDSKRELAGQTDASGRITWPATPRDGIRVEIVDSRFDLTAVTLSSGEKRELRVQPARTVTARLLDAEGHPIPKAMATVYVAIGPGPADVRRLDWTASDEGVVTLAGVPEDGSLVAFSAQGFVTKSMRMDGASLGDVRLVRGSPFVLLVRGDDGPLDGAEVFLEDGSKLVADRSGRVSIAGLDLRQQPQLRVTATHYLPVTVDVLRHTRSPYEVRLRRGSGFRFRLLDANTGEPIEEARVRVRTGTRWGNRELTGPNGEYFAAGFDGGGMFLDIAAPGYLPSRVRTESSNGTTDLGVLFLSRGAVVTGVLTDVRTGEPIAGARLETARRGSMGAAAARLFGDIVTSTTTREGRFELSGLEPGTVCATVSHPSLGQSPVLLGQVEGDATRDAGVIPIGDHSSLHGTLRTSDGSPITDASVELRFGPVFSPCLSLAASLDGKGTFAFDNVTPGQYHLVALRNHEVLATSALTVRNVESNHDDLVIRMVSVHGVISVDGLPGDGGMLMLKKTGSGEFTPPTIFFAHRGPGLSGRQQPATDIVGRTSFPVAPDGTFDGKARLDEGEYEVVWTPADNRAWYHAAVSLRPETTALEVRVEATGASLPGRTTASDGSPIAGAVIRLIDAAGRVHRTTFASPDGAFIIPHVTQGRWTVEGSARDLTGRVGVDVESKSLDPLELVLAPKPQSQLIVEIANDPDTPAIESVLVTSAAGAARMVRATGTATFVDLPPATYKIFGLDRRGGIVEGNVVATGPLTSRVTLDPRSPRSVSIRSSSAEPGARVTLLKDGYPLAAALAYQGLTLSVLDDGTVPLPPLSDGRWTIGIGARTHDIEVTRDGSVELEQ